MELRFGRRFVFRIRLLLFDIAVFLCNVPGQVPIWCGGGRLCHHAGMAFGGKHRKANAVHAFSVSSVPSREAPCAPVVFGRSALRLLILVYRQLVCVRFHDGCHAVAAADYHGIQPFHAHEQAVCSDCCLRPCNREQLLLRLHDGSVPGHPCAHFLAARLGEGRRRREGSRRRGEGSRRCARRRLCGTCTCGSSRRRPWRSNWRAVREGWNETPKKRRFAVCPLCAPYRCVGAYHAGGACAGCRGISSFGEGVSFRRSRGTARDYELASKAGNACLAA